MMQGHAEGLDVYEKLYRSENALDKAYIKNVAENAQKFGYVFFSDIHEQRKQKLNNQKLFLLRYDKNESMWRIDLFHTPNNSV